MSKLYYMSVYVSYWAGPDVNLRGQYCHSAPPSLLSCVTSVRGEGHSVTYRHVYFEI